MKSLSQHINESILSSVDESILSSSGAGQAKIAALYEKCGLKRDKMTFNSDGSIDYDGDVCITDKNLRKLPFKFNVVHGMFVIENCGLTTLAGAPKEVDKLFSCRHNNLVNLHGAPKVMGNKLISFWCSDNKLETLEGMPEDLAECLFACADNELTNLDGSTIKKCRVFDCHNNKLTSLKGGPEEVTDSMFAQNNKLSDLHGSPKHIVDFFNVSRNNLTTLDGCGKCGALRTADNPVKFGEFEIDQAMSGKTHR